MFTTGRTQPGVPCRHLLLLPVALCGPLAGRIFTLSGRLLGFLPVYFCVRYSLVFSLSAFGRRARFGPSGAIFFLLSFLCVLPAFAICFSLFFGSSSRLPFLCFFCFPCGLPFFYFFGFSPGFVLCFISFVFFGYFRFVVISLYIFILFLYFFICPPIDKRKGRVDVGTIYPLE